MSNHYIFVVSILNNSVKLGMTNTTVVFLSFDPDKISQHKDGKKVLPRRTKKEETSLQAIWCQTVPECKLCWSMCIL